MHAEEHIPTTAAAAAASVFATTFATLATAAIGTMTPRGFLLVGAVTAAAAAVGLRSEARRPAWSADVRGLTGSAPALRRSRRR